MTKRYDDWVPSFGLSVWIDASREIVFDLSRSIDVHSESTAGSSERAVDGVTAGHIDLGQEVTWQARHFGITWRMTSRIVELERPICFVDEQVEGPFEDWRHFHRFDIEADGTRMTDHIDYQAPFRILGQAVEQLVLARYLTRLISQRNDFIKAAAESR